MMRSKHGGFTLIELIALVVVLGIVGSGLLAGMDYALKGTATPTEQTKASFLANARMQVILMNRSLNGYAALADPCTTTPALALCTALSNYATANNFSVVASITGTNPKAITVTVSGDGDSVVKTQVYDYASD